jgi:hypothetical protein
MLQHAFVTYLAVTLSRPGPSPSPRPAPSHAPRRAAGPRAPEHSEDLYSLRARRRFASYLRLRLLELREAGLERAADAVERRLPPSALLGPPP